MFDGVEVPESAAIFTIRAAVHAVPRGGIQIKDGLADQISSSRRKKYHCTSLRSRFFMSFLE